MIFATNRQRIKTIDNESINSVWMRKALDKDAFFSTLAQKKKYEWTKKRWTPKEMLQITTYRLHTSVN